MALGRPRRLFTEEELYEYALGALGRRMRSVAELKRLLRRRVEADTELGQTLVELIIRRLKDNGFLNDAEYAAALAQSYLRHIASDAVIAFPWSLTCSPPRSDGYGGGAAVVTGHRVELFDTRTFIAKAIGPLGVCRAQSTT